MSTIADAITRARVRLNETTARKWADSGQLLVYAADAERWLGNFLGKINGSNRFRYRDTWTQSASTETYALTSLTKPFVEVIEIAVSIGGRWTKLTPMSDGDDSVLRNIGLGGGSLVPMYTLRAETLVFMPTPATAQSMAILYRYQPTVKTSTGDTLETPDDYLTDLVNRMCHFALADAGVANGKFEEEYAARLAEIEEKEAQRVWGSHTERIRNKASRSLFLTR